MEYTECVGIAEHRNRRNYKKDPWLWLHSSLSSERLAPLSPHPPPHSAVMNHQSDGHQAYPSSSQDVYHHHRPNPAHNQAMFGPNQRLAANNARRVEYAPGSYITCGTGIFAGQTIRAEVVEVQKANVGRKCVLIVHPMSPTRLGPLSLFETEGHPASLQIRCIQRSTCARPTTSHTTADL